MGQDLRRVDVPDFDFEGVYRGPEGFVQFHAKMSEIWDDLRWEPERHICTMRDGKLIEHVTYWDRNLALEAAGLPPASVD
jgi:hypothetical protein